MPHITFIAGGADFHPFFGAGLCRAAPFGWGNSNPQGLAKSSTEASV